MLPERIWSAAQAGRAEPRMKSAAIIRQEIEPLPKVFIISTGYRNFATLTPAAGTSRQRLGRIHGAEGTLTMRPGDGHSARANNIRQYMSYKIDWCCLRLAILHK